jgi:hypothetical protein
MAQPKEQLSRRGRILADQGLGAHRRDKRRRGMEAPRASYWAMVEVLERAQACERGYQSTGAAGG